MHRHCRTQDRLLSSARSEHYSAANRTEPVLGAHPSTEAAESPIAMPVTMQATPANNGYRAARRGNT